MSIADKDDFEGELCSDERRTVVIDGHLVGARLDQALTQALGDLTRARVQALLAEGRVTFEDTPILLGKTKARAGVYRLEIPAPLPATPLPENLALEILYEDAHLIVLNKAAGMAVHPAPGTLSGTLVNALLHHCKDSLSGIGGVARPGIVHRLDKDTSGVMVVAKTDAAHQGLAALFATHDIERVYMAITRGAPDPRSGTIDTLIGRSNSDRKKMAVLKSGGRQAITHYKTRQTVPPHSLTQTQHKALCSLVACQLETGRTHQIRVHLASMGAPCLGDPVYGSGSPSPRVKAILDQHGFTRQALHAAVLGFVHPITKETVRFETPLPQDMGALWDDLCALD